MTHRLSSILITLGVALAAAAPVCSHAQTLATAQNPAFTFDVNDPGLLNYSGPYTQMGVEFHVDSNIDPNPTTSVYALGFYDAGAPGLTTSHSVGIFDVSTGRLLVQANVAAGTVAPLVGGFRYATQLFDGSNNPINGPLTLPRGYYILQAVSLTAPQNNDNFVYLIGRDRLSTATNVSYDNSEYGTFSSLTYPVLTGRASGYFGGNFLTTPLFTPVPEPGAWALMGGSLVAGGMMWRKRRSASRRSTL